MVYMITNFGSKISASKKEDPYFFNLVSDIANNLTDNEPKALEAMSDMLEVLYYGADIGYAAVPNVHLSPLIGPDENNNNITILIPSPALVDIYGVTKAGKMLDDLTLDENLTIEVFEDQDFEEMYKSLVSELNEEDEDDDELDTENDEKIEADTADSYNQYLHVDKIKQFYRLKKGSDMFKYKKFAKAFYRLGDNYFMDIKPHMVLKDETLCLQNVDITYATKIPLGQIRSR